MAAAKGLNLLNNYVSSIKANTHRRFDKAFPVLSAFSIFNPLALPNPGSPGFTDYGKNEVVILAKHLATCNSRPSDKKSTENPDCKTGFTTINKQTVCYGKQSLEETKVIVRFPAAS